ncbi:peptide chain release factor N(5)-glutamine methyltransferase [Pacificimonas sp. ICDLI1SI03]
MRATDAIRRGTALLAEGAQPETARLDAELLAAHLAGRERGALLLDRDATVDPDKYDELLARRREGEPLAYIVGHAEFWSLTLKVGPATLIPRADSETLIEAALEACSTPPGRILDLGTGSGCLLLAALYEFPNATGLGIDASADALSVARANAAALDMAMRAEFRPGDWCAGIGERFDLILCNPPYVDAASTLGPGVREHEPASALFAEDRGLADYRTLMPQVAKVLSGRGLVIFEIGAGQGDAVRALAEGAGLRFCGGRRDLGGHERALTFRLA